MFSMHEITCNFGLADEHAYARREDILILLSLFCCVALVRIYNAGNTISVSISPCRLFYFTVALFTELIRLRFQSTAVLLLAPLYSPRTKSKHCQMVQLFPFHFFWRKNCTVRSGGKFSPVFPVKRKALQVS